MKTSILATLAMCSLSAVSYAWELKDLYGQYTGKTESGIFRRCSAEMKFQNEYEFISVKKGSKSLSASIEPGSFAEIDVPGYSEGRVLKGVRENGYGFQTIAYIFLNANGSLRALKVDDQGNAFMPVRRTMICGDLKRN